MLYLAFQLTKNCAHMAHRSFRSEGCSARGAKEKKGANMAYRSFRSEGCSARVSEKLPHGITGLSHSLHSFARPPSPGPARDCGVSQVRTPLIAPPPQQHGILRNSACPCPRGAQALARGVAAAEPSGKTCWSVVSKKLAPEVAEERHAALTEQHDKARARVQAAEDAWVCERTCAARQSTHTAQTCARHTCTLPPPPLVQGKLQRVMAATPPGQRRRRGHEENGEMIVSLRWHLGDSK